MAVSRGSLKRRRRQTGQGPAPSGCRLVTTTAVSHYRSGARLTVGRGRKSIPVRKVRGRPPGRWKALQVGTEAVRLHRQISRSEAPAGSAEHETLEHRDNLASCGACRPMLFAPTSPLSIDQVEANISLQRDSCQAPIVSLVRRISWIRPELSATICALQLMLSLEGAVVVVVATVEPPQLGLSVVVDAPGKE